MVSGQDDHGNRAVEGRRLDEQRASEQRVALAVLARSRGDGTEIEGAIDDQTERLKEIARQENPNEPTDDWGVGARRLIILIGIAVVVGYMIYGLLSVYVFP